MKRIILFVSIITLLSCAPPIVGPAGPAAKPCTVTHDSNHSYIVCPDGTTASVTNGTNGTNGVDGINGTNGINATPITSVQLCPNNGPTVYPSQFNEVALCIDNNLYAVYDSGGPSWAFLSLIVPGAYTSQALNSRCNLVVATGCQVTQQ